MTTPTPEDSNPTKPDRQNRVTRRRVLGTGAAVALLILRAALACHDGMATMAEAGIG